ncbi:phage-associated protein [[Clostridium] sordellii]|uniref:Panacea domain-containing protein n=1 Tax=Paraclostridium sordellii TaxID=1505 RepID=UPI0005E5CBEF|nr:type II toxin-antitoxin system antitoxin SocA domain-containing protein [Paeniclostridium sordellii]CEN81423.1 phage-associated protein [[Clostridium] sordellii] [Paeniclostridium sordellii]CEO09265.1 phage-associated protein [[Clostridium] sordellii] [Paeniclostridium sordellii]
MAYNVIEVSQHIINHSIENGNPVTNLKLQKILYYVQAAFLTEFKEECFDDDFEHWRHGPVIPKVYSEYKKYMDREITDKQTEYSELYLDKDVKFSMKNIIYSEEHFCEEDLRLIDEVVDSYSKMEPWDMVDKTHEEEPWINTNSNEIISKESIKHFFEKHYDRIYGGF